MSNPSAKPAAPTFVHDCEECTYLGTLATPQRVVDLYACKLDRSLIARFGDEGWEYSSAPRAIVARGPSSVELGLALDLARAAEAPTLANLRRVAAG